MRSLPACALLLVTVACAGAPPAAPAASPGGGAPSPPSVGLDAGVVAVTAPPDAAPVAVAPARPRGCQATAAASQGATCTLGAGGLGAEACTFQAPTGSCYCDVGGYNCGGAQRPPPEPGTPGVLTCTSDGKRMDGCPAVEPRDAGACADVGQQCTYGDPCGYTQRGYTCGAGGWAMTSDLTRPPPP